MASGCRIECLRFRYGMIECLHFRYGMHVVFHYFFAGDFWLRLAPYFERPCLRLAVSDCRAIGAVLCAYPVSMALDQPRRAGSGAKYHLERASSPSNSYCNYPCATIVRPATSRAHQDGNEGAYDRSRQANSGISTPGTNVASAISCIIARVRREGS